MQSKQRTLVDELGMMGEHNRIRKWLQLHGTVCMIPPRNSLALTNVAITMSVKHLCLDVGAMLELKSKKTGCVPEPTDSTHQNIRMT
jgi:hypothetical protein